MVNKYVYTYLSFEMFNSISILGVSTYILIALIFAQIKFIFKNFVLKTRYINSLANEGLI